MPVRTIAAAALAAVLAMACSGGDPAASTRSPSPDANAGAATPGDGPGSPDATRSPGGEAGSTGAPTATAATPTSPRPTAPPGIIFPPQGDRYVYQIEGKRRTPSMPAVVAYPADASWVWTSDKVVPVSGSVEFHYETRIEADDADIDIHLVYERAGLRLGFTGVTVPGAAYACIYEPDIELVNAPVAPGRYPQQDWSGSACTGTTDVRVVAARTTTDANGVEHRTWEIREETSYTIQLASGTVTATRFYSPDLGIDVRIDRVEDGTVSGKPYRYEQAFLLAEEVRGGG